MGDEETGLQPSTFVELKRAWKSGDTVELTLPKSLRLEPTPDNKRVAAIMWGPLVLAGNLGPRREGRASASDAPAPVLVTTERPLAEWIVPAGSRTGDFKASQVVRFNTNPTTPADVSLTPFYRTHRRMYSVYFDVLTPTDYEARAAAMAAERERIRRMEAATTGFVQPGEMQPERDYNYQSEPADRPVGRTAGRGNRGGAGWFSFDMPVDATTDMALVVTYFNEIGLGPTMANFQILVDGTSIAKFEFNRAASGFWDAVYAVPQDLVRGKTKVTVKFQAGTPNGRIAPMFGARMIRRKEV
jgi:hypothetical protein